MKKIIIVLIVMAIGMFGSLAYFSQEEHQGYGRREKIIEIDSPFERDEKANLVMEHVNSIDNKEEVGNIHSNKEGAIVTVSIYGAQYPRFEEHIGKIERLLEVEGIKAFINDEQRNAVATELLEGLEMGEGVRTIKNYEDIIVVSGDFNRYEFERGEYSNKSVDIIIPREKIKDPAVKTLTNKIKGDKYYLKDYIVGGENEMLILANQTQLINMNRGTVWLDEEGQVIEEVPAGVRYEILLEQGKVDYIKGIAKMIVKDDEGISLQSEDIEVFLNAARELGLDETRLAHLEQIIEETIANPMKNRKEKIGGWQYSAKYTTDSYNMDKMMYLEIILK